MGDNGMILLSTEAVVNRLADAIDEDGEAVADVLRSDKRIDQKLADLADIIDGAYEPEDEEEDDG